MKLHYSERTIFVQLFRSKHHGTVRIKSMENCKTLESTSSSNRETSERGYSKNEKTPQKITTVRYNYLQYNTFWVTRYQFIIDRASPNTLIPNCSFIDITEVPMKIT